MIVKRDLSILHDLLTNRNLIKKSSFLLNLLLFIDLQKLVLCAYLGPLRLFAKSR